jgi:hypothetical protein
LCPARSPCGDYRRTDGYVSTSRLAIATSGGDDLLVQEWHRDDGTLILEVLARLDEHVLEVGQQVVYVRSLLEDEDGEEEEEEDRPEP